MTPTEANIARLQEAAKNKARKLGEAAAEAGVPAATLYDMARPGWRPRSIKNLIAVERALGLEAPAAPLPAGEGA